MQVDGEDVLCPTVKIIDITWLLRGPMGLFFLSQCLLYNRCTKCLAANLDFGTVEFGTELSFSSGMGLSGLFDTLDFLPLWHLGQKKKISTMTMCSILFVVRCSLLLISLQGKF